MWSATSRLASRYFLTSAGDIASDSPELSKPAWLAGSTGNSLVGRGAAPLRARGGAGVVEARLVGGIHGKLFGGADVDAREIADGVVVFGVAQAAREHDPG